MTDDDLVNARIGFECGEGHRHARGLADKEKDAVRAFTAKRKTGP